MTRLCNDPTSFVAEMLDGFVDAHADRVRRAPGGVVRSTESRSGKVAVVIGGGSGHYPAFAGLVGAGLADGAVVGDVFASPSAQQIVRLARAADHGGGVLLAFGNYTGDVLNFTLAAERLRLHGIQARLLAVTDDIASAPAAQESRRRGIAGDLIVFKIAGAAAEAGYDLAGVAQVAGRANDRTRSIGVAFAGCTLPGSDAPLFALPAGTMGVGLGVHGEPGIRDEALPSADGLAELLVSSLLAERRDGDGRVAAVLNGLGSTKYEELFVLWRGVSRRLAEAGLTVVGAEVGELITSLDMAGCSLTLCWLDDELARLWAAPADSAAYRKGVGPAAVPTSTVLSDDDDAADLVVGPASGDARRAAARAVDVLRAMADALHANEDALGRLDAVAGDGDHGRGMTRGCDAALAAASRAVAAGAGVRTAIVAASMAWGDRAGGTSGALWSAGLLAFGRELDDDRETTAEDVGRAVHAALGIVGRLGGALPGDKTLVDALHPFAETLSADLASGADLRSAWTNAAAIAQAAADATAELRPRLGRARPLAERSIGSPDPGAVSLALCLRSSAPLV